MNAIPIFAVECVDHLGGEQQYTMYPETPESSYGYGPFGDRIGATIERGQAVLIGHVYPDPGVTVEVATSKWGEALLYIEGVDCGIPPAEILEGGIKDISFQKVGER